MGPKNQKTYCPVCSMPVVIGEDTEDAECPNCTYQFRTPWGRVQDALKAKSLEAENVKLKEEDELLKQLCDEIDPSARSRRFGREG